MVDGQVQIRRPLLGRIYMYVFAALCVGFFGLLIRENGVSRGVLTITVIFLLPVIFTALTAHRIGVFTRGRELVVRGQVSTRRFKAEEIEDFRVVTGSRRPGYIILLMIDGRVIELMQTSQPFWGIGAETLHQRCTDFQRWLTSTRPL
ncbi:MAG: hypothetical protein QOI95_3079 [Acidimicrobiaceae bacterium]